MPFPLIFGILAGVAAAAIGTVAVLANWDEIVDWFKKEFLPTLEELWNKVKSDVIHAAKVFVDKVLEKGEWLVEFIHKLYYKEDNQWYEQTTTRKCDEDKVPDWAKAKAKANTEPDVTDRVEQELQVEI